jgi:signal transduction histidine kinase
MLTSLQVRMLALIVVVVAVALGTVAVVARASTSDEFSRYVDQSRQEMQVVAREVAATTGERLVVTTTQGRVIMDSSGELVGSTLSAEEARLLGLVAPPTPPGLVPAAVAQRVGEPAAAGGVTEKSADVLFLRRDGAGVTSGVPSDAGFWTLPAPAPPFPFAVSIADTREQAFLDTVTRSLIVAVGAAGVAAVVMAALFARGILRPIGALTVAARQMERGDLSQRVQVTSSDEIGQLGQAFNAMADGLARTEQLRRNMVADVAHELRTPLTNLRGYLEAMRDGVLDVRPETIESLYDEALLLSSLVDDMQDLTLSDAGRLSLHRELVDPAALVNAAAHAAQPHATQQGVELVVDAAAQMPSISADPQRVGQVLRNLLSNAIAYTPSGGTVHVAARASDDAVRVDVRDTGCGIAPEHLPDVFERFYRADPSRARATGGAGIGLALVKQFVHAHGGEVFVASTPGQGTCFSFTLPRCAAEERVVAVASSA